MNSFSQSFEIIGYQAWPAHMQDRFVSLIPAMPPGNDQEGIAIVRQGIAELKKALPVSFKRFAFQTGWQNHGTWIIAQNETRLYIPGITKEPEPASKPVPVRVRGFKIAGQSRKQNHR
jgi:hypothetical protein